MGPSGADQRAIEDLRQDRDFRSLGLVAGHGPAVFAALLLLSVGHEVVEEREVEAGLNPEDVRAGAAIDFLAAVQVFEADVGSLEDLEDQIDAPLTAKEETSR